LAGKPLVKESWLPDNPPLPDPNEAAPTTEAGPTPSPDSSETVVPGETDPESDSQAETGNHSALDDPVETQEPATPSMETSSEGGYTIQVAAVRDLEGAQQMVAKLQQEGFPAYALTQPEGHGNLWYRIRVGSFTTQQEARATYQALSDIHYTPVIMKY
jgi:cell division protein FtsN